jgi:hypothetical protein
MMFVMLVEMYYGFGKLHVDRAPVLWYAKHFVEQIESLSCLHSSSISEQFSFLPLIVEIRVLIDLSSSRHVGNDE